MNAAAAITGASSVAFVTAEATSHGDTASSRGHRPADRGSRRRDRHQRIGQRRPGRFQRHRIRADGHRHLREYLPDLPCPAGRPAQPAAHRVCRDLQLRRDPALPPAPGRRGQRRPRSRVLHPSGAAAAAQAAAHASSRHAGAPATWRGSHRPALPARPEHRPLPGITPPGQPSPARRAAQAALFQHPLDASRVVAYREHRCSFAPARGPPRGFAKRSRGGPLP